MFDLGSVGSSSTSSVTPAFSLIDQINQVYVSELIPAIDVEDEEVY
jgi:hypothetical protein